MSRRAPYNPGSIQKVIINKVLWFFTTSILLHFCPNPQARWRRPPCQSFRNCILPGIKRHIENILHELIMTTIGGNRAYWATAELYLRSYLQNHTAWLEFTNRIGHYSTLLRSTREKQQQNGYIGLATSTPGLTRTRTLKQCNFFSCFHFPLREEK